MSEIQLPILITKTDFNFTNLKMRKEIFMMCPLTIGLRETSSKSYLWKILKIPKIRKQN